MAKLLCVLMSADKPLYNERRKACLETWAAHVPGDVVLKVYTGKDLSTGDDHSDTSIRLRAVCQKVLKSNDWEWLLKVDDDVVIDWQTMKRPPVGSKYHGAEVPGPGQGVLGEKYVFGAAMWLSRKAVEILAVDLQPDKPDDQQVGEILRKYGITPTLDVYHHVSRRPGLEEISPFDSLRLSELGFALEVGHPTNIRKLWLDLQNLPKDGVRKAVYRAEELTGPKRGPAIYNPDYQVGQTEPAVSRPQRDPGFKLFQR